MTIDAHTAGMTAGRTLAMQQNTKQPATKKAAPHGTKLPPNGPTPYYTTHEQAQSQVPPDILGATVKYAAGKGYYVDTGAPAKSGRGLASTNDLLAQAAALARGDVSAQVAAIQGVQASERSAAQERARQIMLAAKAAAGLQTGIGDQTQAGFTTAAKDIAGMAQGFSGDLKNTASSEAQKVLDQLQSVGATNLSPQVQGQGDALANVSYGLGGYLPASALLTGGTALAAAQRQLPASTLAYGGQESLGAIAAGENAAKAYDPKILDAQAGLPAAVRQYLSTLSGLKKDEFDQKLALAKYQTGIDQFNTRTGIQVGQFNTRTKISMQRLNLDAQKFAQQTLSSDRRYQISLAGLGITQKRLQLQVTAQEYKLANGGYTPHQIGQLQGDAALIAQQTFNGFADSKGKEYPPLNFGQALEEMRKGAGGGRIPLSIALTALKQAGFAVPERYHELMGGLGHKADPFSPSTIQGVVGAASSFLGVPYKWGGNDPKSGLDCSSFIQQAFAKLGINLPRTTYAQVKVGTAVDLASLQPGDVVFTRPGKNGPNHVGLYIGNGQIQESPHTGDVNKIIDLKSFLSGGFVAARRYGN